MAINSFPSNSSPPKGVNAMPAPRILPSGRVSRIDQLKSQPRKPGEASFFMQIIIFSTTRLKFFPASISCRMRIL